MGKRVDPDRIIVTGPPVDPRIIAARKKKNPFLLKRPLRLCITTGGLGTNKDEIHEILHLLFDLLKQEHPPFNCCVMAEQTTTSH